MTLPALVAPDDLDGFPGAPFDPNVLAAAAADIRGAARWHIAPQVTETLTVETGNASTLFLPSLFVVSVSEVRRLPWDTDPVVTVTDWRFNPAGYIRLRYDALWPAGTYEVDVVHGFESCPEDLFPVIANTARDITTGTRLASLTQGPFSESYRDDTTARPAALSRVTLPPRF